MSTVAVGKSGQVYRRHFDHDEARALRTHGLTLREIARRLGVSTTAIEYATNDDYRERQRLRQALWLQTAMSKTPCACGCGELPRFNRKYVSGHRPIVPHGTAGRYSNHGCRCELCREAWRRDYAERAHRLGYYRPREQAIAEDHPLRHGAEAGYRRGCRCSECREAARLARAHRRAKAAA